MADLFGTTITEGTLRRQLIINIAAASKEHKESLKDKMQEDKDPAEKEREPSLKKRRTGDKQDKEYVPQRACINPRCGKLAEEGECPKHGGPKKACSITCYQSFKREKEAAADREATLAKALDENTKLQQELHVAKTKMPIDLTGGKDGQDAMIQKIMTDAAVTQKALLHLCGKMDKKDDGDDKAVTKGKQGKALHESLMKLTPHKVPIEYFGDPEEFGLHVHRALQYTTEKDTDHGAAALYKAACLDMEKVLAEFKISVPEAMRQTNTLVLKMFGWAGDYEVNKGIEGALAARMKQARAFSEEVDKMQHELRKFTSALQRGEDFVDRQLLLFANGALGSTVSRAAIKAMAKQDE
jgi:hypothetical protein